MKFKTKLKYTAALVAVALSIPVVNAGAIPAVNAGAMNIESSKASSNIMMQTATNNVTNIVVSNKNTAQNKKNDDTKKTIPNDQLGNDVTEEEVLEEEVVEEEVLEEEVVEEEVVEEEVLEPNSNGIASSVGSTDGVLCDYSYDAYNDTESVLAYSTVEWTCENGSRVLTGNGIPDHEVGEFPNQGNPNTISEQEVSESYTLEPTETSKSTTLGGPAGVIGYILNGVKIDASTAGSCDDSGSSCSLVDNSGAWSIEALGQSSFDFGDDDSNAHVQPTGAYHYHGMPEGFITKQGGNSSTMTIIGWAADGFPIYARYGYSVADNATSAIVLISSSYQLVTDIDESRPDVDTYALGTFAQDWEYVEGSGDLDECNGRTGVTPEFPEGTYHYYATDSYPYLQRCIKGDL